MTLIFVAALPPPTHGQSLVTRELLRHLSQSETAIVARNISPGALHRSFNYHIKRSLRVAFAALTILFYSVKQSKTLYTVVESGPGILYNYVIVGLARLCKYRIVLHHHTSRHSLNNWLPFAFLSRVAGRGAYHCVLSHQMAMDLRDRYHAVEKILILQNVGFVYNTKKVRSNKTIDQILTLGLLGNITVEKGVGQALDVLRCLRRRNINCRIILAGPAAEGDARAIINHALNEMPDAVRWEGPIDSERKEWFFQQLDILLFPSRYKFEAQPLVILEAMSAGVPVIATNQGYIKEMFSGASSPPVFDVDAYVQAATDTIAAWSNQESWAETALEAMNNSLEMARNESKVAIEQLRQILTSHS